MAKRRSKRKTQANQPLWRGRGYFPSFQFNMFAVFSDAAFAICIFPACSKVICLESCKRREAAMTAIAQPYPSSFTSIWHPLGSIAVTQGHASITRFAIDEASEPRIGVVVGLVKDVVDVDLK